MHCKIYLYEVLQNTAYEALQRTVKRGTATYSYMRHCNIQLYEALEQTCLTAIIQRVRSTIGFHRYIHLLSQHVIKLNGKNNVLVTL